VYFKWHKGILRTEDLGELPERPARLGYFLLGSSCSCLPRFAFRLAGSIAFCLAGSIAEPEEHVRGEDAGLTSSFLPFAGSEVRAAVCLGLAPPRQTLEKWLERLNLLQVVPHALQSVFWVAWVAPLHPMHLEPCAAGLGIMLTLFFL
jgi:hypothetical protein